MFASWLIPPALLNPTVPPPGIDIAAMPVTATRYTGILFVTAYRTEAHVIVIRAIIIPAAFAIIVTSPGQVRPYFSVKIALACVS